MPSGNENLTPYFVRVWKELSPGERKEVEKQEIAKVKKMMKSTKWKKSPSDHSWVRVKTRRRTS